MARFPALFVLGIVTSMTIALNVSSYSLALLESFWPDEYWSLAERIERLAYAGVWGMLSSVLAQQLAERRFDRRVQLSAQVLVFAVSLFLLPLIFLPIDDEERRSVLVVGVSLALYSLIIFILTCKQGQDIAVPNCIISTIFAGIFCLCAIPSLIAIYFAFTTLVMEFPYYLDDNILGLIIYLPLFALAPMIFIAFAAREREDIALSFAYQFIMRGIILPLEISWLVLLYFNLFKSLFTLSITTPVKEIYIFISIATGGYPLLYFASLPDESPFLVFFRRYGALFMLPLLTVQIAVFAIKIDAEGYTPARVASLLYIIFSVASCALTSIKHGKYSQAIFLIFAVLCILGSATPLNIIDIAYYL